MYGRPIPTHSMRSVRPLAWSLILVARHPRATIASHTKIGCCFEEAVLKVVDLVLTASRHTRVSPRCDGRRSEDTLRLVLREPHFGSERMRW